MINVVLHFAKHRRLSARERVGARRRHGAADATTLRQIVIDELHLHLDGIHSTTTITRIVRKVDARRRLEAFRWRLLADDRRWQVIIVVDGRQHTWRRRHVELREHVLEVAALNIVVGALRIGVSVAMLLRQKRGMCRRCTCRHDVRIIQHTLDTLTDLIPLHLIIIVRGYLDHRDVVVGLELVLDEFTFNVQKIVASIDTRWVIQLLFLQFLLTHFQLQSLHGVIN